jgi:hypothetical protein
MPSDSGASQLFAAAAQFNNSQSLQYTVVLNATPLVAVDFSYPAIEPSVCGSAVQSRQACPPRRVFCCAGHSGAGRDQASCSGNGGGHACTARTPRLDPLVRPLNRTWMMMASLPTALRSDVTGRSRTGTRDNVVPPGTHVQAPFERISLAGGLAASARVNGEWAKDSAARWAAFFKSVL